jgi:hypothetical protein
MIFVDSNIPMYLVGAPHPHKDEARAMLERAVVREQRLVTSVEVLQEILHRYVAIERRDAISPAFEALLGIVDEVFDVTVPDGLRARDIVLSEARLSARGALHIAVMERNGVESIMSFDGGFDRWQGLTRLG